MKQFVQTGDIFRLGNDIQTHSELPVGNYLLNRDDYGVYFLTQKEPFKKLKKLYGNHDVVNRWAESFKHNTEKNMGIILSGLKGTGKTITAQLFCELMNKPVILIDRAWHGTGFIDFLSHPMLQNSIIFIDEFEKVYGDSPEAASLLSLLDGNYNTNLIFLFTVNQYRINEYLINRLNRIKYHKGYGQLEDSILNDIVDDMLIHKHHKESVINFFYSFGMTTFDLAVNIIKEVNLFDEDAFECASYLNLKLEEQRYNILEILPDGKRKEMAYYKKFSLTDSSLRFDTRGDDGFYNNSVNIPITHSVLTRDGKDLIIEYKDRVWFLERTVSYGTETFDYGSLKKNKFNFREELEEKLGGRLSEKNESKKEVFEVCEKICEVSDEVSDEENMGESCEG